MSGPITTEPPATRQKRHRERVLIGLLLGHSSRLSQRLAGKTLQFRAVADLAHELTCFRRLDGSFDYLSSERDSTG